MIASFKLPPPSAEEIDAAFDAMGGYASPSDEVYSMLVAARPVLEKELQERIERAMTETLGGHWLRHSDGSCSCGDWALERSGGISWDAHFRAAFWRVLTETPK